MNDAGGRKGAGGIYSKICHPSCALQLDIASPYSDMQVSSPIGYLQNDFPLFALQRTLFDSFHRFILVEGLNASHVYWDTFTSSFDAKLLDLGMALTCFDAPLITARCRAY